MKWPTQRRTSREQDLEDEIAAHLSMATRDRVERGEDPEEARHAARREFGNVGLVKEVTRSMWGWQWAEQLVRDLQYAARLMVRAPAFTAVIVLTLALGIGANTAIFTVVHAVLLEPLPFKDPSRLVVLWEESAKRPGHRNTVSPANFLQWRDRSRSFERMAASYDYRAILGEGDPEELTIQAVNVAFFPMLGVAPVHGRLFNADDAARTEAQGDAVMLTGELWERRFGRDPHIVGRTIRLGGRPATVVGVMPRGVRLMLAAGSLVGKAPDAWVPFEFDAGDRVPHGRFATAFARLKPDVAVDSAQAEMDTIAGGLARDWPAFDKGWGVKVVPLHRELAGDLRPALIVLTAAVAFVLLIACANVGSLLLARGATRRHEFALRAALGAARARVARQLLAETGLLVAIGGVLGLLFAWWGVRVLVAVSPVDLTHLGHLRLSYPILAFAAALCLATALLCGLAPLVEGARVDPQDGLKEGGRAATSGRTRRMRRAFVVAEVALVMVLLVGAGLLMRTFTALNGTDPGFDGHNVLTARIALPSAVYTDTRARTGFFRAAVERVSALPGVRAAGAVSFLPFAGLGAATKFQIEGRPPTPVGEDYITDVRVCDNGYFAAMRIPLLKGRLFSERETREASKVVIINQALARQYFGAEDPLGQQLSIVMTDPVVPTTIIGVVGSVKEVDLATQIRPAVYWPLGHLPYSAMTVVVRADSHPMTLAKSMAREVRALDAGQPLSDVRTMEEWVGRSLGRARFNGTLLTAFALFALFLASLGIYGVVSYSVAQQSGELAIRMALGAVPGQILRMVLRDAVRLTAIGAGTGLVMALLLTRYLGSLLYRTNTFDAASFGVAIAVLATVAVASAWLPARRAAHLNAVDTLRSA